MNSWEHFVEDMKALTKNAKRIVDSGMTKDCMYNGNEFLQTFKGLVLTFKN